MAGPGKLVLGLLDKNHQEVTDTLNLDHLPNTWVEMHVTLGYESQAFDHWGVHFQVSTEGWTGHFWSPRIEKSRDDRGNVLARELGSWGTLSWARTQADIKFPFRLGGQTVNIQVDTTPYGKAKNDHEMVAYNWWEEESHNNTMIDNTLGDRKSTARESCDWPTVVASLLEQLTRIEPSLRTTIRYYDEHKAISVAAAAARGKDTTQIAKNHDQDKEGWVLYSQRKRWELTKEIPEYAALAGDYENLRKAVLQCVQFQEEATRTEGDKLKLSDDWFELANDCAMLTGRRDEAANIWMRGWDAYTEEHVGLELIFDNKKEAETVAERLLKLYPDHTGVVVARGQVAYWSGDMQTTRQMFDRAMKLDPNVAGQYYNQAVQFFNHHCYQLAYQQFATVVAMSPTQMWMSRYYLAACAESFGRRDEAISQYEAFLRQDPPADWATAAQGNLQRLCADR